MRMLDLFCGRWGWSRAFAARGHQCVGVDLRRPPETPEGCNFLCLDVMDLTPEFVRDGGFDFICASSPCQEFSVWGMPHFHPEPKYPALGIRLFNHTRALCEASGLPYVMENVRPAQSFVGLAKHHCGPYYLWGKGVPPLLVQGITKGMSQQRDRDENGKRIYVGLDAVSKKERAAESARIPPELAASVVDYAERICEAATVK